MLDTAPVALAALLATAAGTGVVHTLAGPDHYVPLLGAARANGWTARTTLACTAMAGLLHCAASALLAPFVWRLGADLAGLQAARGRFAAWAMLGVGLALLFVAWRRGRRPTAPARGLRGVLLLLFAVGPCEWLLPNVLAAAGAHGAAGAAMVAVVFTAATTLTMVAVVACGLRVLPAGLSRWRGAALAPGALLAFCGATLLLGW